MHEAEGGVRIALQACNSECGLVPGSDKLILQICLGLVSLVGIGTDLSFPKALSIRNRWFLVGSEFYDNTMRCTSQCQCARNIEYASHCVGVYC